jgi:hypothetical protein
MNKTINEKWVTFSEHKWRALSLTFLSLSTLLGLAVSLPIPKASADAKCTADKIVINNVRGPDPRPPATVWGHDHLTGNHYVHHVRPSKDHPGSYVWYWWADNSAGRDDDTVDTPYRDVICKTKPGQ